MTQRRRGSLYTESKFASTRENRVCVVKENGLLVRGTMVSISRNNCKIFEQSSDISFAYSGQVNDANCLRLVWVAMYFVFRRKLRFLRVCKHVQLTGAFLRGNVFGLTYDPLGNYTLVRWSNEIVNKATWWIVSISRGRIFERRGWELRSWRCCKTYAK